MSSRAGSLQHRFIAGLGFRTRWTYRASSGGERRLPADHRPADSEANDGGWLAARQATALLLGLVPRTRSRRERNLDGQAIASLLQRWIPSVVVAPVAPRTPSDAEPGGNVLAAVAEHVAAGNLVLLRYAVGERPARWCLVSGVEWDTGAPDDSADGDTRDRVSALLLLDSDVPAVWGCGYNARLEAVSERLQRRTLDGGLAELHIVSWLAVRHSTNC